jgi:HPt (histidine-containing phosphotransfer) domain-containing protein
VVTKITATPQSLSDAAAGAAIDSGVLAGLRADCDSQGAPLSDELLEIYGAELQPRLGAIHAAINRSDASALRQAAHALKGSSSLLGARPIAQLCRQLERAAINGRLAQAQTMLPELAREAARLCKALAVLRKLKAEQ